MRARARGRSTSPRWRVLRRRSRWHGYRRAAGNLSLTHRPPRRRSARGVSATGTLGGAVVFEQSVGVARVNRVVAVTVEHYRGHYPVGFQSGCRGGNIPARGGRSPLVHRGERGGHVVGGAGGETRMDADRGVEIWVGLGHDRRHRPTSRHASHVYSAIGDVVLVDNLTRDARDQRRLAPPALLVRSLEPVPALVHVGALSLRGVC